MTFPFPFFFCIAGVARLLFSLPSSDTFNCYQMSTPFIHKEKKNRGLILHRRKNLPLAINNFPLGWSLTGLVFATQTVKGRFWREA